MSSSQQYAFSLFFTWDRSSIAKSICSPGCSGALYIHIRTTGNLSGRQVAFGVSYRSSFVNFLPSTQLKITIPPSSALSLDADTVPAGSLVARPAQNYCWRRSQRHHTHRFLAVARSAHYSIDDCLGAD